MTLLSSVGWLGSGLAVNMQWEQILDMSRLRNNVIVDAALAAPFVEWLRLNKDILGVSKI